MRRGAVGRWEPEDHAARDTQGVGAPGLASSDIRLTIAGADRPALGFGVVTWYQLASRVQTKTNAIAADSNATGGPTGPGPGNQAPRKG